MRIYRIYSRQILKKLDFFGGGFWGEIIVRNRTPLGNCSLGRVGLSALSNFDPTHVLVAGLAIHEERVVRFEGVNCESFESYDADGRSGFYPVWRDASARGNPAGRGVSGGRCSLCFLL